MTTHTPVPKVGDRFTLRSIKSVPELMALCHNPVTLRDAELWYPWLQGIMSRDPVLVFQDIGSSGYYRMYPEEPSSSWKSTSSFDPGWIIQIFSIEKSPMMHLCECDMRFGCTCGAMVKDMAARGLVKCPYTRLWIKKDE